MNKPCKKMKDKITDYVLGILDEDEIVRIEEHIKLCSECKEHLESLQKEKELILQFCENIDIKMGDRTENVITALEKDSNKKSEKSTIFYNIVFRFTAAAAIVIVAIIGLNRLGSSSVAWADVVERLKSVTFFNATFYLKENTSAEPVQIDVWMGHRGKARIKVKEQVLFSQNGKLISGFNYVNQEEVYDDDFNIQARSVISLLGKSDSFSLETVVQGMSRGVLKEITPIINPQADISEDIVVFDLTSELYPQWLRIWALRESKLPIRILAWSPENGQSIDVVLTYTKEQSEAFYDSDEYQKVLENSQNLLGDKQANLAYALYKEPGGRNFIPQDIYEKYHNVEELRTLKEHLSDEELVEYYKAHPLEEGQIDFRKGLETGNGYTIGPIKGLDGYEIWRIGSNVDFFAKMYPDVPSYGRMRYEGDFNDIYLQYDIIGRSDIPNQKYVQEALSRVGIEVVENEDLCTVWIAEYNGQELKNPHSIKIPFPNAPSETPGSLSSSGWSSKIKYVLNNLAKQQDIVVEDKTGIDEQTELTWQIPNFKTQVGADLAKEWFEENFGITFKIEQRPMKVWIVRKKKAQ